jgi:hypothetical protein
LLELRDMNRDNESDRNCTGISYTPVPGMTA